MANTFTTLPEMTEEAAREEVIRRFSDRALLTSLINQAVHEAVLDHKRVGNPVAGRVNGKIVIVQPEDIELPEE